jgi:hypothetical protein
MTNEIPAKPEGAAVPTKRVEENGWKVLLVEDDETTVRQIGEFFAGHEFDGKRLDFTPITDWDRAIGLIKERKADLVILDIYRGKAAAGAERIGEVVLQDLQRSGFVPVVIHTNLPEGLEGLRSEFVRLVPKTDGLPKLSEEIGSLFTKRIPQLNRAILNHVDRALCEYMWGFVARKWAGLKEIADRPEFVRLLLHRLAFSFARVGVEQAVSEAFQGYKGTPLSPETVHPAEFYIMPPMGSDPYLGDVRIRKTGDRTEFLVVIWPSCDFVSTGGRTPKTDIVLCARAAPLADCIEAREYAAEPSETKRKKLRSLMANNLNSSLGSAASTHYLPGFLNVPDLIVEFRKLEVPALDDLKKMTCLGTLASPYAEEMSFRFDCYRGRLGVPDLDLDQIIAAQRKDDATDKKKA